MVTFAPHASGNLKASMGAPCNLIEETINRLGLRTKEKLKRLSETAHDLELAGTKVQELIRLLARSRKVELDIIKSQFGTVISEQHLSKIKQDIEELEKILEDASINKGSCGALIIHSAKYGVEGDFFDVTDRLRSQIANGRLDIAVSNKTMGCDPVYGITKYLEVDFEINGKRSLKKVEEGNILSLRKEEKVKIY